MNDKLMEQCIKELVGLLKEQHKFRVEDDLTIPEIDESYTLLSSRFSDDLKKVLDSFKSECEYSEFEQLTRPIIKFLNDNYHHHSTVIIDTRHAEVLEGSMVYETNDYIKDQAQLTRE